MPGRPQIPSPATFFDDILPRLVQEWGRTPSELYQFDNPRFRNVYSQLAYLEGASVLDIGCNSGLYSLLAGAVANRVVGIDGHAEFIELADRARVFFQENMYDVAHVTFHQVTFERLNLVDLKIDCVLACNVLYHLTDYEIERLASLLESCQKAFFQMRPRRRLAYERHPDTFYYVSRTTKYGGLYTVGHALEMLQDTGFRRLRVECEESYWDDESFPLVLAERKALT